MKGIFYTMDENKKKHLEQLCVRRAQIVYEIRKEILKKTQQKMADALGMSRPTYNKEENSQQVSALFYFAIGSYLDYYYKELLKKWVHNYENNDYKKEIIALTSLLNHDNLYRIKKIPISDTDYEYFLSHSFNQEWWDIMNSSSYNKIDNIKIENCIKARCLFIYIDDFSAVELENIFNRLTPLLKKHSQRISILTDNKQFQVSDASQLNINKQESINDKIIGLLLMNRNFIDFSYSECSYNESIERISHLINLKSRIFILTKKIWLLNDRRIFTNKKTKKIIKRVIKESNLKKSELKKSNIISYLNSVLAGYFTDYFCYINWENNNFVHHDFVFENVYKEIPDDAILSFIILIFMPIISDENSNINTKSIDISLEKVLKEEFPSFNFSIYLKYINMKIPQ